MTTAHRPTFDPARGKSSTSARQVPAFHARQLPAHTHLKARQPGQGGDAGRPLTSDPDAVIPAPALGSRAPRGLRQELLAAEAAIAARQGRRGRGGGPVTGSGLQQPTAPDILETDGAADDSPAAKRRRILEATRDIDADSTGSRSRSASASGPDSRSRTARAAVKKADNGASPADSEAESLNGSSSEESEEEEEEDETALLLRELAAIKSERAAQKATDDAAQAAREEESRAAGVSRGNPLLDLGRESGGGSGARKTVEGGGVKRRWDDDVVFKNQGRDPNAVGQGGGQGGGKEGRGFVNDLLRSDFHKRFMGRYVR